MAYSETAAGILAGTLIFLAVQGMNIFPVLFILVLAGALYYASPHLKANTLTAAKNITPISFNDIGGQEVAKNERCEALEFIQNPEYIKLLGIRPLKGIF